VVSLLASQILPASVGSTLRNLCGRVLLRLPHGARSGSACVTVQWRVWVCRLFTSGCAVSVWGAPGFCRFGLSAKALGSCCSRVPTRLTIRSSRRRISASLKLAVRRAILALHCRGRRGLTQALGAEETLCGDDVRASALPGSFAVLFGIFVGAFRLRSLCSARSGIVNLFFMASVCRQSRRSVSSFGCSVWHFDCACAGRARFTRLRSFGPGAGASFFPGSFAPNSSFKPTPHRGVARMLTLR
jgi:hypothetical protein